MTAIRVTAGMNLCGPNFMILFDQMNYPRDRFCLTLGRDKDTMPFHSTWLKEDDIDELIQLLTDPKEHAMRWYSIKDYIPPTATEMLVRIQKQDNNYERYIVAKIEDTSDREDISSWELSPTSQPLINLEQYTVTHFMVIEPVLEDKHE